MTVLIVLALIVVISTALFIRRWQSTADPKRPTRYDDRPAPLFPTSINDLLG